MLPIRHVPHFHSHNRNILNLLLARRMDIKLRCISFLLFVWVLPDIFLLKDEVVALQLLISKVLITSAIYAFSEKVGLYFIVKRISRRSHIGASWLVLVAAIRGRPIDYVRVVDVFVRVEVPALLVFLVHQISELVHVDVLDGDVRLPGSVPLLVRSRPVQLFVPVLNRLLPHSFQITPVHALRALILLIMIILVPKAIKPIGSVRVLVPAALVHLIEVFQQTWVHEARLLVVRLAPRVDARDVGTARVLRKRVTLSLIRRVHQS